MCVQAEPAFSMMFWHFYHYFAMLNGVRYREIFGCLWVLGPIKRGVVGSKSGEEGNVCRRGFSAESAFLGLQKGFWRVFGWLRGWVGSCWRLSGACEIAEDLIM